METIRGNQLVENLTQKYAFDREMIREILTILVQDLPKSLRELEQAVGDTDFTLGRKAAHSLANISGTVMEIGLLELARKIESGCIAQNLSEVIPYLDPIREQVNNLCTEADTYLQN